VYIPANLSQKMVEILKPFPSVRIGGIALVRFADALP
jgi:hypothetical protein